jgi:hypothetical protein
MLRISILLCTAILLSGCIQQIAVNSLGGVMDNGFSVLNEEQDLQIASISAASNLKLLETILRSSPGNSHYLLLASEGYSSYALAFVEDDSIERARMLYMRGRDFGFQILSSKGEMAAALHGSPEELQKALEGLSNDDVPAVFWTAVGWGSAIALSISDPEALADLPRVETMMHWVLIHDPAYFYGGAHFFLGTLDGTRPKALGGNPESSRRHFEECLKINGGKFLMAYVYYARSYAVQTQDKALFEACLTRVDTTSLDILPDARLSNQVAKRKAKLLRSHTDELF